jgi:hypothetical protein
VCGTDFNPDVLPQQHRPSTPLHSPVSASNRAGTAPSVVVPATLSGANGPPKEAEISQSPFLTSGPNKEREPSMSHPSASRSMMHAGSLTSCSEAICGGLNSLTNELNILSSQQPVPYTEMNVLAQTISALADALQKVRNAMLV